MDIGERLAGPLAARLREVVRSALGAPDAEPGTWRAVSLYREPGALSDERWLYLLAGVARVGGSEQPWNVVLKTIAPSRDWDDPSHIRYWKREWLLYRSGALDALPGGLRAPRCYGCDELPDGSVLLWLEHVREDGEPVWPIARWALAARHLGQLHGADPVGRSLRSAPWLGGRRLRTWLELHRPHVERIAAAADNPELRRYWPRPIVDGILRLWQERDACCGALESLPQTLSHGDAIRRNLFARRRADGSDETVAIDWENAGRMAVGEEIGQTLSVAAAFFDLEPADLPTLDEALFAGYLAGLADAGWRSDERQVRFACAAHAALRNAFNAVGATLPDDPRRAAIQQTHGHSWEELAERRAAIRPFLLARADEARRLLASL